MLDSRKFFGQIFMAVLTSFLQRFLDPSWLYFGPHSIPTLLEKYGLFWSLPGGS